MAKQHDPLEIIPVLICSCNIIINVDTVIFCKSYLMNISSNELLFEIEISSHYKTLSLQSL